VPTYEYECTKCGDRFDVFQTFAEEPLKKHPGSCRGKVVKVMSPAGIVFSGSGFYKTDNRSSAKNGGAKNGSSKSESSESTKTDSPAKDSGGSSSKDSSSSSSGSGNSGSSSGSGASTAKPAAAGASS
jgi:putative FmdB family regulatory protein